MSDMSSMSSMELGLVYGRECLFYRCTVLLRFHRYPGMETSFIIAHSLLFIIAF